MPWSKRFEDALVFAHQLHRDQLRKGTSVPYVTHLLGVAAIVGEHTQEEDAVIAALLHDAIEDQGGIATRDIIAAHFGEQVAGYVDGCTDSAAEPRPPWRERKETYIEHLTQDATPEPVLLISAADKLHNVRSIILDVRQFGVATLSKFTGAKTAENVLWYYSTVADLLSERLPGHPLPAELQRAVGQLKELLSGAAA